MKKVLILLSIACVVQGLYSQPTQYKHLNTLPDDFKIRIECEQVNRAWFIKGEAEIRCDDLDDGYDIYAPKFRQFLDRNKEKVEKDIKEYSQEDRKLFFQSSPKWHNFKDRTEKQSQQQNSDILEQMGVSNSHPRAVETDALFREIRRKEFCKFEQDMISRAKK